MRRYDQNFNWNSEQFLFGIFRTKFFTWEKGEVKGQKQLKVKDDSNIMLKRQRKRAYVAMKALLDEMKITIWRSMQGIKDKKVILSILAPVKARELSLD